jgi:hypothetical protein
VSGFGGIRFLFDSAYAVGSVLVVAVRATPAGDLSIGVARAGGGLSGFLGRERTASES